LESFNKAVYVTKIETSEQALSHKMPPVTMTVDIVHTGTSSD